MKAIVSEKASGELKLVSKDIEPLKASEVQLKVITCGICLGDEVGMHHGAFYPLTPGHEVVGEIKAIGDGVHAIQSAMDDGNPWKFKTGQRVGLGWFSGYCKECYNCRRGYFTGCKLANATGLTRHGGWSEYVNADYTALVPWPQDIDPNQAPMMCAGLTVFNAIRNSSKCKPGNNVGIIGMGGLGTVAIPLVKAFGMNPIVISGSKQKESKAKELGASAFISRQDANFVKQIREHVDSPYGYGYGPGGVDILLTTSPDVDTVSKIIEGCLAMEAEVIMLSEPADLQFKVPVIPLLIKRATIKGWSAGCPRDVEDLLVFCRQHSIWNVVEEVKLEDVAGKFQEIGKGIGRFVIRF